MQNEEYYDLYIREWNKMLKWQNDVTDAERKELHELIETQKGGDKNGRTEKHHAVFDD